MQILSVVCIAIDVCYNLVNAFIPYWHILHAYKRALLWEGMLFEVLLRDIQQHLSNAGKDYGFYIIASRNIQLSLHKIPQKLISYKVEKRYTYKGIIIRSSCFESQVK